MGFFDSKKGKRLMGFAYGWGAAVVIAGALFKLMHWPGAGAMLTLGMSVEAFIFFISAFEPLAKEYHWEAVFPELLTDNIGLSIGTAQRIPQYQQPVQAIQQAPNFNLDIDKSTAEEVKSGMKKFADSLGQMSNISSLMDASNELTGKLKNVSGSMNTMGDSVVSLSESYQKNIQAVSAFSEQAKSGLDQMHSGYEFYRGQLETIGRTMGALNSSYELYLQEAKKVQTDYSTLHTDMQQLISNVNTSINESKKLGSGMMALNTNVEGLNTIYGNMLTSVSSVLNK